MIQIKQILYFYNDHFLITHKTNIIKPTLQSTSYYKFI